MTFNQLDIEEAALQDYFLRPQVEAVNLSCVGVMTTEKGFFLSPEMDQVADLVEQKRAGRKVVVFGQSMGGYAALKFSARLRADFVIAASPFFSVHESELELPDDRHRRILMRSLAGHGVPDRPEFAGMAIGPADVSGRIVVIFDPAEMIDAYGVRLISKHVPQAEFITVPHAGHVIYDTGWSGELTSRMLQAVQSPDATSMGRTMTQLRRNQFSFLLRTLSKAANRKPRLCCAAMGARRVRQHPEYRNLIGDSFNLRAIFLLAERNDPAPAAAHLSVVLRDYYRLNIRPAPWHPGATVTEVLKQHRCLILSFHGTFLTWNVEQGAARFEMHPFKLATRLPIVASMRDGVVRFEAIEAGVGRIVALTSQIACHDGALPDEIVAVDRNIIAIRNGDQYLGAVPDGGIQLLGVVNSQQRMVILPLLDSSELFDEVRSSWFDQAIQSHAVLPANDPSRVVQRATQRWRRLFKKG